MDEYNEAREMIWKSMCRSEGFRIQATYLRLSKFSYKLPKSRWDFNHLLSHRFP